jgi:hypothetical protein
MNGELHHREMSWKFYIPCMETVSVRNWAVIVKLINLTRYENSCSLVGSGANVVTSVWVLSMQTLNFLIKYNIKDDNNKNSNTNVIIYLHAY